LVDEQQVLEALESAPDYEQVFASLNDQQRGLVERLLKAAGNSSKQAGKKQKCMSKISLTLPLKLTIQRSGIYTQCTHTHKERETCPNFHQESKCEA